MERKAQDRFAKPLRNRAIRCGTVCPGKSTLCVHRFHVVNHGGNVFRFQVFLKRSPVCSRRKLHGILCPAARKATRHFGQNKPFRQPCPSEFFIIECCGFVYVRDFIFFECIELNVQDCRLNGVKAAVQTETDVIVLIVAGFSVNGITSDEGCPCIVVGKDRATVSVTSERLCGKKTCRGNISERASPSAVQSTAEPLCAVFQQKQSVFFANRLDCVIVGRKSEKIHRHHDFRRIDSFLSHSQNGFFKPFRVDIIGTFIDIHKNTGRTLARRTFAARKKREVGNEHGIPFSNSPRFQSKRQRVRSVGAGNAVLYAYIICKPFF